MLQAASVPTTSGTCEILAALSSPCRVGCSSPHRRLPAAALPGVRRGPAWKRRWLPAAGSPRRAGCAASRTTTAPEICVVSLETLICVSVRLVCSRIFELRRESSHNI
ncbi:uncharacterized protein [Miscanthus floridulus]|uniref:uncharacterized protein n=1 Tax=Miscanthus floridulus TaxID=154761 RepID=UPI00345A765E